jgi:hypothetical protein
MIDAAGDTTEAYCNKSSGLLSALRTPPVTGLIGPTILFFRDYKPSAVGR